MSSTTNAREEMLSRIRQALQDIPAAETPETLAVSRAYLHQGHSPREEVIECFIERVADYKVQVRRIESVHLGQTITEICTERQIRHLVVPVDLPVDWAPANVELLRDEPPLSDEQLDQSDGVLTGCALGIAQTGTIVLDGGEAQGRRVLTLLPDYHLCVIHEEQVVELVPEAIERLSAAVKEYKRPLTFISGPSATSDIELNRVEGVHGPRTLDVLVVKA